MVGNLCILAGETVNFERKEFFHTFAYRFGGGEQLKIYVCSFYHNWTIYAARKKSGFIVDEKVSRGLAVFAAIWNF